MKIAWSLADPTSLQDLVNNGALVGLANKFGDTALEKCKPQLVKILSGQFVYEISI